MKNPLKEFNGRFRKSQMNQPISVSVSRKNNNEMRINKNNPLHSDAVFGKTEDFNNIVVMSGTAKRKPLEKKESRSVGPVKKSNLKKSFLKLRAPFYKSHQKQSQAEEKLMTKSCEVLFDCIKPYKNIQVAKKVTKSIEGIGSILKMTDIVFEKRAVRKVQFFSFSEETPSRSFFFEQNASFGCIPEAGSDGLEKKILGIGNDATDKTETKKTVSSEDFITDVLI